MAKITFEDKLYFKISLSQLLPGKSITFPLYVYMQMNASMVLRYAVDQVPRQTEIVRYLSKGLESFCCPDEFHPAWLKYLESPAIATQTAVDGPGLATEAAVSMSVNAAAALKQAAPISGTQISDTETTPTSTAQPHTQSVAELTDEQTSTEPTPLPLPMDLTQTAVTSDGPVATLSETAALLPIAKTLARDLPGMTPKEKKEKLVNVGNIMLKSLTSIATGDQEKKWQAIQDCKMVTKSIVEIGLQSFKNRSIYDDLVALSEPDIEHSTTVSTIATIFALISGFSNETELADISMSGLIHDVGLSLIPPELALKPLSQLSEIEFKLVKEHPLEGAQILEEFGMELSPLVKMAVFQHHERFDGMGYPKKLRGVQIDERVQIIHLADLMADLMRGQITGQQMNPREAFLHIKTNQEERHEQQISFEIFVPIQQAALNHNQASEALLKKTGT